MVLTHDHALDFLIVREALARGDAAYVGMIGSRTKRVSFERWLARGREAAATPRARLPDRRGRAAGQAARSDRGFRRRGDHADGSPRGRRGPAAADGRRTQTTGQQGETEEHGPHGGAHRESMLDRFFKLTEHGTNVRTEVIAGITTFLTMAYIIFVNPQILATTGMDQSAVFVATCLAAALGSAIMGLYANWPIAMAPGMGLNAFFAFTVVGAMGFTWQQALGAVFISGCIFLILTVTGVRRWLVAGIPHSMRSAVAAGIGMFLGIIALKNAGIVVASEATFVTLGDMTEPAPLLAILGFFLIAALDALKVKGSILIGILAVTVVAIAARAQPVRRRHVDAAEHRADLPAARRLRRDRRRHRAGGPGLRAGRGLRRHRHADRRRQARGPADRGARAHQPAARPRAAGRLARRSSRARCSAPPRRPPMSRAPRACRRAGGPG